MEQFKYFPHTEDDVRQMLQRIGVKSLDELYAEVPEQIRFRGDYDLPSAMSEEEIRKKFELLSVKPLTCFAGAGCYDHYTPALAANLISRSEYLTSYTPYQAEISQGTLHYIFEYQTMMARLTGMDVSNASMYDGATATAEAMLMAFNNAKKATKVLVSATIDPKVRRVVDTYAHYHGVELQTIAETEGETSRDDLRRLLAEGGVAGVIVQTPNRYGIVEDLTGFADDAHNEKALFIVNAVASDLALLKTPGEWGADIACGDGQSLGIPMSFGGPSVGFLCCTDKLIRKMPGRIVGQTVDTRGQRAFALTLQAREQHIRRQKATSNICSNQSLMALFVTIYLAVMGKQGTREVASRSYKQAHWLCEQLVKTRRFEKVYDKPFFNEFCLRYNGDLTKFYKQCTDDGLLPGVMTDEHTLMVAVTEKRTKREMDFFIEEATR